MRSVDQARSRPRVSKACERCRIKKAKCDGLKPCGRCNLDRAPCSYKHRRKPESPSHTQRYIDLLLDQHAKLAQGLLELYSRCARDRTWDGPPIDEVNGAASVHCILEHLGVLDSDNENENEQGGAVDRNYRNRDTFLSSEVPLGLAVQKTDKTKTSPALNTTDLGQGDLNSPSSPIEAAAWTSPFIPHDMSPKQRYKSEDWNWTSGSTQPFPPANRGGRLQQINVPTADDHHVAGAGLWNYLPDVDEFSLPSPITERTTSTASSHSHSQEFPPYSFNYQPPIRSEMYLGQTGPPIGFPTNQYDSQFDKNDVSMVGYQGTESSCFNHRVDQGEEAEFSPCSGMDDYPVGGLYDWTGKM